MPNLFVKIGAKTGDLARGLEKASSRVQRFGSRVDGFLKPLRNIAFGVAGMVGAIGAGVFALAKMGGQMEQTQIAMEIMLGSAERAKQLMGELRQFADVTPFDTNSVIAAGRAMLTAGVAAEDVTQEIRLLGNIAAGVGRPLNDISEIYVRMKNLGRVTFKELNSLARLGVINFEELRKKFGKNEKSLRSFVEAGNLGFKDIRSLLGDISGEGGRFNGVMERLSQTFTGRFSTLTGKLQNLGVDIGQKLLPGMESITETFIDWSEQAKKAHGPIAALAKLVEGTAAILETTRGGNSFMGIKTAAGLQTNIGDTAADALANIHDSISGRIISFANPIAALGQSAGVVGQQFGMGIEAKEAALSAEHKQYLEQIVEANQKTNNALESKGL